MEKKIDIIDGKVTYDNQEYCFNYSNNRITLYPKELEDKWESIRTMFSNANLKNDDNTINLYGETSNGNPIAFIKLKLNSVGRGIFRSFVPAYILGNCNAISPLPEVKDFKKMVFKGKCIDNLYNPMSLLKKISHTQKFKPIIKFNELKEVENKIHINEDIWKFNIGWNVPYKDRNTVITLSSQLSINFNNLKNVDEIIEYYIKIEKLLGFLNNRQHVIFSEINLYTDIKFYDDILNKVRKDFVTFHLYINEREDIKYDLPNKHKQIAIEDLSNHIENLYNEINKNPFIDESLPNNTYDSDHLDNDTFIKITSAFESEFDRAYPNYKTNTNVNYKRLKDKVLKYIEDCKEGETKRTIKYLDNFYNNINNLEGTLPEQICYALKEYTKPLEKIKQRLFVYYKITNVNNGELAQIFANKRNSIAHGKEIKKFIDIEVVAYVLVERLIYCLLLKRVGFSIEEINNILDKIFE